MQQAVGFAYCPTGGCSACITDTTNTTDTAVRLARYFGGDAGSWLALQAGYDLKTLATRDDIARKLSPREAASG